MPNMLCFNQSMALLIRDSRLRELREAAGWSRTELARRAGVNARTIEAYETGNAEATVPRFTRLADALGVTLDELAGRPRRDEDVA